MSHLTVQKVIEKFNETSPPAKDQRITDNRTTEQPHRPEFYIPRITRRVANMVFGGNTVPIFPECSNYLIVLLDQNCQSIVLAGRSSGFQWETA